MSAREWVVTFGYGQALADCYATLDAESEDMARKRIAEVYGTCWSFLYPSREEAGVERFGLREVKFGTRNVRL